MARPTDPRSRSAAARIIGVPEATLRSLESRKALEPVADWSVTDLEVIATAPMNSGNSGGPLLNAAGQVMGSTTYSGAGQAGPDPWFVSMAVPALCSRLVNCTAEQLGWQEVD